MARRRMVAMEKRISTADRPTALAGLVGTALSFTAAVLSLLGELPSPAREFLEEYGLAWWMVVAGLLLLGLGLLLSALFTPKSRLLQPARFVIRPDERRHLKGREEEISELSDLCERHPLVFLEGESGAGKSALVRAGLLDECDRRGRLHPVYADLSGADWEERLPNLLCGEIWLSLSQSNRESLALKCPSPPGELFPLLASIASRLGRIPLLVFDQIDDYQGTYRHRFREGVQANTWITHETLTEINGFWKEVARLLRSGDIHCLCISRTDNAAGLDALRFVGARTYRISRVSRNLIAPLLDEITAPESESRPVVARPEKGWEMLKGRLLSDLTEDDAILPIQLSVALQALRRFPVLTVREYERRGGVIGLERFYIEQNLIETSHVSSLDPELVRKLLVGLVEPARHKALQLRTSEIEATLDGVGASKGEVPVHRVQAALEYLEGRNILRRRPAEEGDDDIWLLQHDFLCQGVLAAERHANRWHAVLEEGARQWREAGGTLQHWKALLSPWRQVQLAFGRLAGKLRYGSEKRFVLLSTLRFLPYALVLLGIWGALLQYRVYEDEQEARRILAVFEGARMTSGETEEARALVSARAGARLKVLELAFADEKKAELARRLMPMLLHVYLGLDPAGDLRKQFWSRIAHPALEKYPGLNVVLLALVSWKEAPGEAHDAKALAGAVGRVVALKSSATALEALAWDLAPVVPYLDSASAQALGDELLKAMDQAQAGDGSILSAFAKVIFPLEGQLRDDQKRHAASCLMSAISRAGKDGDALPALVGQMLPFKPYVDSGQAPLLADGVVRSMTRLIPAYGMAGAPEDYFIKPMREMLQKLDGELTEMVLEETVLAIAREARTDRLAQLTRGFALLAPGAPKRLRQEIIRKVVDAVAKDKDLFWSANLAASLGELASELSPEQARIATAKLIEAAQALAEARDEFKLAPLARALGLFKDWLEPEDARRASALIMGIAQSQALSFSTFFVTMWEFPVALRELAPRLSGEQRTVLLDDLVAEIAKRQAYHPRWRDCLKELADICGPDTVRHAGQRILEAMDQEKDEERFSHLCHPVAPLAGSLDPELLDAIGTRLVEAVKEEKSDDKIFWLGHCFEELEASIGNSLLNTGASKLIEAAGKTNHRVTRLNLAETLEKLLDRLEPEYARRATEIVVRIIDETETQEYQLQELLGGLDLPDGRFSEEKARKLSETIARTLDRAALEETIYFWDVNRYGIIEITGNQARQNVAALLSRAPDQQLLDILKRPFAVSHMREVVLGAWELKYGQHFENDLWRFVRWAMSDPRTCHLNFR
jgi:hypothetical protein